jgi:hypothetical protein
MARCVPIGARRRRRQLRAILEEEDHAKAQMVCEMELI